MEGECLVEAKEYKVSVIQWLSSITLWGLPVIPWLLLGIITAIIARFLLHKYPAWDSKKKDGNGHPNKPRHEKWLYAWIIGLLILSGCWSIFPPIIFNQDITIFQIFRMQYIPAIILTVITLLTVIILFLTYLAWDSKNKDSNGRPNKPRYENWFYVWLIGLSTLGGFWALFLPLALNQKFEGVNADGNQLRLHLLYITGGVLALTTLGETHRKNTLEKTKNDQDHTQQVHAERRSRYTTAIEQLSNSDSATTRLGGVYSLVGLVDEWLADENTIPNIKERRKKGQVIINNLCAYIRSPFPLAERAEQLDDDYTKDLQNDFGGDKEKFDADKQAFARDKAALEEERQVRRSIIEEICERLQDSGAPGPWSNFDYDFSNTHFFYYTSFMDSHFNALLKFSGTIFEEDTNFFQTTFKPNINLFFGTNFKKKANFMKANFKGKAHFSGATFTKDANFFGARFTKDANFRGAKDDNIYWTTDANFIEATFKEGANFSQTTFQIKPIFESTLDKPYQAWFSNKAKLKSYKFKVSYSSPYKIDTEEHRSPDGTITTIPKGCSVFNPSLTKISISDDSIKGISVKGVSANGAEQIQEKLEMSPWPKKSESNTKH